MDEGKMRVCATPAPLCMQALECEAVRLREEMRLLRQMVSHVEGRQAVADTEGRYSPRRS